MGGSRLHRRDIGDIEVKTIEVHKAQGIGDYQVVESTTLLLHDEVPQQSSLMKSKDFYKVEAKKIMEALSVLPQGTKYELLCMMLESAPVMYRGK
jgi:hypothetical protein